MSVTQINAATLKEWMERGEAILVDVREISEYKEAHIPGAILIPVGACHPEALPQNPDKKLVFQCKAGGRSSQACNQCIAHIPGREIYNLEGGITAWMGAGYAVERAP